MGIPVLVFGKSGSGKSRSLKEFDPAEIVVFNVENKPFPFRKQFDYAVCLDNVPQIQKWLNNMPHNAAVIDDAGYIMTHHFMRNHRNKKGNSSFEMYDDIADMMFNLVTFIKNDLPRDKIVYIVMHEDQNVNGDTVLLTLGKLLDQKVNLVGMVTICLRCMSEAGQHYFRTVTDGSDVTKAPEEMFNADEIPNDLKAVDSAIREFYGLDPLKVFPRNNKPSKENEKNEETK